MKHADGIRKTIAYLHGISDGLADTLPHASENIAGAALDIESFLAASLRDLTPEQPTETQDEDVPLLKAEDVIAGLKRFGDFDEVADDDTKDGPEGDGVPDGIDARAAFSEDEITSAAQSEAMDALVAESADDTVCCGANQACTRENCTGYPARGEPIGSASEVSDEAVRAAGGTPEYSFGPRTS